ncbi:hypothetical protein CWI39_2101p0010, partial [Hamiltosporidium magnivora]
MMHKHYDQDIFIELILNVPISLSVLIPCIRDLAEPLCKGLRGNIDLQFRSLRTLELCLDNLNLEYVESITEGYMYEIVCILMEMMGRKETNSIAARILGKLKTFNRKFLESTQTYIHKSYNKGMFDIVCGMIGVSNGLEGVNDSSRVEGVNDSSRVEGVSDTSYEQQGVSHPSNNQQGVSNNNTINNNTINNNTSNNNTINNNTSNNNNNNNTSKQDPFINSIYTNNTITPTSIITLPLDTALTHAIQYIIGISIKESFIGSVSDIHTFKNTIKIPFVSNTLLYNSYILIANFIYEAAGWSVLENGEVIEKACKHLRIIKKERFTNFLRNKYQSALNFTHLKRLKGISMESIINKKQIFYDSILSLFECSNFSFENNSYFILKRLATQVVVYKIIQRFKLFSLKTKIHFDYTPFIDALIESFGSTNKTLLIAQKILKRINTSIFKICETTLNCSKVDLYDEILKKLCSLCSYEHKKKRKAGINGLIYFIKNIDLGDVWLFSKRCDILSTLLFYVRLSDKECNSVRDLIFYILRRTFDSGGGGEGDICSVGGDVGYSSNNSSKDSSSSSNRDKDSSSRDKDSSNRDKDSSNRDNNLSNTPHNNTPHTTPHNNTPHNNIFTFHLLSNTSDKITYDKDITVLLLGGITSISNKVREISQSSLEYLSELKGLSVNELLEPYKDLIRNTIFKGESYFRNNNEQCAKLDSLSYILGLRPPLFIENVYPLYDIVITKLNRNISGSGVGMGGSNINSNINSNISNNSSNTTSVNSVNNLYTSNPYTNNTTSNPYNNNTTSNPYTTNNTTNPYTNNNTTPYNNTPPDSDVSIYSYKYLLSLITLSNNKENNKEILE